MKTKHIEKADELIDSLVPEMKKTVRRLLNSGAVDVEGYSPDEYSLAKILVTAAMTQHGDDYSPLDATYRKDLKNLEHF